MTAVSEHESLFHNQEPAMSTELVEHRDPTPMMLLQQAVDAGLNPDHLEKLMLLQERYERNQAEKAFNAAMHDCQQEMPKVVRNAENLQTKSMYADLEAVQNVARPVYTAHGFSLSYGEGDCPVPSFKRTVCDVRHVGGHCVRYHLDLPIDGVGPKGNPIGGMNAVQGCISTTSYGQRRLLCMIFNITLAGEDDDGQGVATIDDKQVVVLNEWMEVTNTSLDGFLKWAGCKTLNKFPQRKFPEAIMFFERRQQQQKAAGK